MDLLIVPIIGAIIGLFTNWLAIKMLFLPRREYKLWGKRVPFTPGVLPKSKSRVAKNLGHAVGDYLLTDETLAGAITGSGVDEELFKLLDKIFNTLKANESTIGETLEKICPEDYEGLLASTKEAAKKAYTNYIGNEENIGKVKEFAFEKIKDILLQADAKALGLKSVEALDNYTLENGIPLMNAKELEAMLDGLIQTALKWISKNESDMRTLVSDKNADKIKSFVETGVPVAFDYLKNILDNNEELDMRLGELTRKIVEDSVGQFVGSMVHRKVYLSIKSSAGEFLSGDEGKAQAVEIVNGKIEEFLLRKPDEVMALINIGDDLKASVRAKIVNGVFDNHRAVADYIFSGGKKTLDKLDNIDMYKLANRFLPEFDSKLKTELDKIIDDIINKHSEHVFEQVYGYAFNKLMNMRISQIAHGSGEKLYAGLVSLLEKNKDAVLEGCVSAIIGKLDISKTVEEQINKLDVRQMENIVLEVARKELDYITYMGGVLGFVMGFIPEIIKVITG